MLGLRRKKKKNSARCETESFAGRKFSVLSSVWCDTQKNGSRQKYLELEKKRPDLFFGVTRALVGKSERLALCLSKK